MSREPDAAGAARPLPSGSCDTHCHVFGPIARFPWAEPRSYTPEEAPREALFAMHDRFGIDRGVIVQPTCHGTDNRVTLDAIAARPGSYRGIALIERTISDSDLAGLHAGGIRGVRFTLMKQFGPLPSPDEIRETARRIAAFGWQMVIHVGPDDIEREAPLLAHLPLPVVIDHIGRIDVSHGIDQRALAVLLELGACPHVWIKVSGGDRASARDRDYADVVPFIARVVEAVAERTLWGTDWPHPNVRGPVPAESDLIRLLEAAVPDAAVRRRILIDNPGRLYGFA